MSSSGNGPGPAATVWTREQAIDRLREGLLKLSDGERSMCSIAAELGIFCRGFRRWPDGAFQRHWSGVMGRSTHLNRPQLERLADLWQLTEQVCRNVSITCDAMTAVGDACRGFDEFSDRDLEKHCLEILGRKVAIHGNGSNRSNRSNGHDSARCLDPASVTAISFHQR